MNRPAHTLRSLCPDFWRGLLSALSIAALLLFYAVALGRLTWPFDLEWMEGGMIMHAARLLHGEPIYAAPSLDFVPYFYTPGYPALLAGLAWLQQLFGGSGLSFGLARAVSLACTTWTLYLLFRIGQREANARTGLYAAGLYAALFRTNGAFYDLARPDALLIALLCSAVYVAAFSRSWRGAVFAGAILALGFFTKQTVSVFMPAIALAMWGRSWRHALSFAVTATGLAVLGVWLLNRAHDGWFWTYIFQGHQGHLFYWKNILMEYWRDVLFLAPALLLVPLLWFRVKLPIRILSVALAAWWTYAFVFRARTLNYVPHMYYRELWYETPRWQILVVPAVIAALLLAFRWRNRPAPAEEGGAPVERLGASSRFFWLWMFAAGVGASGLNHSTQWAYANCFMLISAFGAVLIALAVHDLGQEGPTGWRPRWSGLVPAALCVQFVALAYSPKAQRPQAGDAEALAQVHALLDGVSGPVFFPAHPLTSYLRDGTRHTHQMGIQDVRFLGGVKDLAPRLSKAEFGAVLIDEFNQIPFVERGYYHARRLQWPTPQTLRARTGFEVRPQDLWLPHRPQPAPLVGAQGAKVEAGFEQLADGGGPEGWQIVGEAFAQPARRQRQARRGQGRGAWVSAEGATGSAKAQVKVGGELGLLLAATGARKGVRVWREGEVVAELKAAHQRHLDLQPRVIDLRAHEGQIVTLEVYDDAAKGSVALDALRWW